MNKRPTRERNGIHYLLEPDGRLRRYTPWLGDWVALLYDRIMRHSIFPRKFGADIDRHEALQGQLLVKVYVRRALVYGGNELIKSNQDG